MADADGIFRMPIGTYSRFDEYSGNGQSALLQDESPRDNSTSNL